MPFWLWIGSTIITIGAGIFYTAQRSMREE